MSTRPDTSFANYRAEKEAAASPEQRLQTDAAREQGKVLYKEHFSIGEQLAALRKTHHLTQGQLADATGIGQSEISRIEAGKANPTQDTLSRLGASLGAVLTFSTEDGRPIAV